MKCRECPDYRECNKTHDLRRYRPHCAKAKEQKVFTNGDRYRAMSDREMAETLSKTSVCPPVEERLFCGDEEACMYCWLEHLRSPVKERT